MRATVINPDSYPMMREMIAAGSTIRELADKLGCGTGTVVRVAQQNELGKFHAKHGRGGAKPQPIHPDFADMYHRMTNHDIAKTCKVHVRTVTNWAKQLNLPLKKIGGNLTQRPIPEGMVVKNPIVKSYVAPRLVTHHKGTIREIWRDSTEAGKAQEILQRDKWAVYRCDESGRQDATGKLWRCGRVIVTDAELIERAARVTARMGRVGV